MSQFAESAFWTEITINYFFLFFGWPSAKFGPLLRQPYPVSVNCSVLPVFGLRVIKSVMTRRFPKTGRVFSRLWTENLLIRLQCLDPLDHSPITLYMLVALWWISGKTLLISYSHFSGFLWFVFLFETKKRELAQANESYAGENSDCYSDCYLLYLVPSGNNKPFRVTPSTSSGYCRYSVSWWPALTTMLVF